MLYVAALLMLAEFIGFKLLYPYANFLLDSNFYIDAAYHNLNIDIWPVAYSKFLRLFSVFTHSDLAFVTFQFALVEISILYFYFTLLYFMRPGKWVAWLMIVLLVINPAILSISNYILSDSIFTALTLIWFSLMVWNLCKPRPYQAYTLAVLLFFLFMLRYYAIFYPLLTFAVILISKLPWRTKITSIGLAALLLSGFIWHTSNQYEKLLGRREFSAFSGWQIASNALIMYRNLHDYSTDKPPANLMSLHQFVTHQLDSFNHLKARPDSVVQFFYMWSEVSPLRKYMRLRYQKDSSAPYFKRWASMGDEFKEYGTFLVKKHPLAYVQYYMGLGLQWYAVPTDEALKTYNSGQDSISPQIKDWFDFKSRRLKSASKRIYTLSFFPVITAVLNALTVISVIGYFALSFYKKATPNFTKIVLLFASYWIINFFFSVVSAPMMLRYQITIMLFAIAFGSIIVEMIYNSDREPSPHSVESSITANNPLWQSEEFSY